MAAADSDEETILQFTSSVYLRIRNSKTSLIDLNDISAGQRPPSSASSVCGSIRSTRYDTIAENPTDEQQPQLPSDEVFKSTEEEVQTYPFSDSGVSSLEEVFVRDSEDKTEDTETEVEKDPNQVEKKKLLLEDIRVLGHLTREDSSSESTLSIDESNAEEEDTPVQSTEESATEENIKESDPAKLNPEPTVPNPSQESSTAPPKEEIVQEPASNSNFARGEEGELEEGMSTKQAIQTHDARKSVLEDIRKIGEKRSPESADDQLDSKRSKPSYTSSESDDSLGKPPAYTQRAAVTPAEEVQSSLPPGGANPPVREPKTGSQIPQSVLAGGKPKGEPKKPRGVQEGNVRKKASFFRKKGQDDEELSKQPSPPPKIRTSGPGVMDRIKTFFGKEKTSYDLQQAQTDVGIRYGTSQTLPDQPKERKSLLELEEEAPKLRKAEVEVVEDEEKSLPTPTVVRSQRPREPSTPPRNGVDSKVSMKAAAPEVKAAPVPEVNASTAGPSAELPTKDAKLERKTSTSTDNTSASSLDLPKKKKLKKKERKSSTFSKSSVSSLSSVDDRKGGPMDMDAEDSNLPPSRVVGSKGSSLKRESSPEVKSTPPLEVQKPPSPVVKTAPPIEMKKTPPLEVKAPPPAEVQHAPPPVQKVSPPVVKAAPAVEVQRPSSPIKRATPPPEVKRPSSPVKKTSPVNEVRAPSPAKSASPIEKERTPSPAKSASPVEKPRTPSPAKNASPVVDAPAESALPAEKVPTPTPAKNASPVEKPRTPSPAKSASPVEEAPAESALPAEKVPTPTPAKSASPVEKPRTPSPAKSASPVEEAPAESALPAEKVPTPTPAKSASPVEKPRTPSPAKNAAPVVEAPAESALPVEKVPTPTPAKSASPVEEVPAESALPAEKVRTPSPTKSATPVEKARTPSPPKSVSPPMLSSSPPPVQKPVVRTAQPKKTLDPSPRVRETVSPMYVVEPAEPVKTTPPPVLPQAKQVTQVETQSPAPPVNNSVSLHTARSPVEIEGARNSVLSNIKQLREESSSSSDSEKAAAPTTKTPMESPTFPVEAPPTVVEEVHSAPPPTMEAPNDKSIVEKIKDKADDIFTKKSTLKGKTIEGREIDDVDQLKEILKKKKGAKIIIVTDDELTSSSSSDEEPEKPPPPMPEKVALAPADTAYSTPPSSSKLLNGEPETSGKVIVSGSGLGHVPVHRTARFAVTAENVDELPMEIIVTGPRKDRLPCRYNDANGSIQVEYVPEEVGEHDISVKYNGTEVPGGPFVCHAYDITKIKVSEAKWDVGKDVEVPIDTSRVGHGNLSASVSKDGRDINSKLIDQGDGKQLLTFNPGGVGLYNIGLTFNKTNVPVRCPVIDPNKVVVKGEGYRRGHYLPVGDTVSFNVDTTESGDAPVVATVTDAVERDVPCDVYKDGSIHTAAYTPKEAGDHKVNVKFAGLTVASSPVTVHAYDINKVSLGPLSKRDELGYVSSIVETKKAGPGILHTSVTTKDEVVSHNCDKLDTGKYKVSFQPKRLGQYEVHAEFNDITVPGSPLVYENFDTSDIMVSGEGLGNVPAGKLAKFQVDASKTPGGDVVVKIAGPRKGADYAGSVTPSDVDKVTNVEYLPSDVGQYDFLVLFDGEPVKQEPFISHAYDASAVAVNAQERGKIGKEVCHKVDTTNAGQGVLKAVVAAGGQDVPSNLTSAGEGLYDLTFTPKTSAAHLTTFSFNDEVVKGSPFTTALSTPEDIVVMGAGMGDQKCIPVNKEAIMKIDATKAGDEEVVVKVAGPTERDFPCEMNAEDQIYSVNFTPVDVGDHKFMVKYGEEEVKESPFIAHAFDPSKVEVQSVPKAKLGQQVSLKVDGRNAGKAELTGEISKDGDKVPSELWKTDDGRHMMTFVANELGTYNAHIRHGGLPVEGSPFPCKVFNMDAIDVHGDGVSETIPLPVNEKTAFYMETKGPGNVEDALVKVFDPTGKDVPANITSHNGTYTVDYTPREIGPHKVRVHYDEKEVSGSPYIVNVFDANRIRADPDRTATVNQPVNIKVDARDAGPGKLTYTVDPIVSDVMTEPSRDQYLVQYTPTQPGTYSVHMKYNNKPVPGSPFQFLVLDTKNIMVMAENLSKIPVNEKAYFFVGGADNDDLLGVHVRDPKGLPLRYEVEDSLVSFIPQDVVDCREAGPGDLNTLVMRAGSEVPTVVVKDTPEPAIHSVRFTPTEPEPHDLHLEYHNTHVPGTPFVCDVQTEPEIGVVGDGLVRGYVDEKASFDINAQNCKLEELGVRISNSNGFVPHEVDSKGDQHKVIYTPRDAGPHTVDIVYFGKHVNGSPFYPNISAPGNVQILGKHGEMVADRRKLPLTVDKTCNVELDASTAGPGTFKSVVRGPSGEIQSSVTDIGNDRHNLKFTPLEKGNHDISVLYAGRDIKHSPFRADVQEPDIQVMQEVQQEQSAAPPLQSAAPPLQSAAPPLAPSGSQYAQAPSGSQHGQAPTQPSRPVEAPPSPPTQVPSPAQVPPPAQVSPPEQVAQPAEVPPPTQVATTPPGDVILKGLPEYANAKTAFRVNVDTRPAPGGGTLASRCFGPSKSSDVQLFDFENGTYELRVTPKEKGRHTLEVVYDQKHAPGSPHVFDVSSKSDYKRVKVFGPGLNNGMINYYRGNFLCDTRGAGEGDLSVRIQGPKGAFKVRMNPLAENDRVIAVSYDPTYPGNYDITVKWSDKHVPGSPFRVFLAPPSSEPMGPPMGQPDLPPMMGQSIPRTRGSSRY
ncbi:filamin-A-like isoform X2 [Branchiostoma lanceolatum]|uniref:filamin-A-like isoform X2 n=1 Tax=Branchiostoma lanceolatum TaxID=7740 RepID=UPI0034564E32